jgi:tape measure domain-containing protein
MENEIRVNFASKGDDEVLDAIKKVTRHVGDLKKIAKTPIDLDIIKKSMPTADFNRLRDTIERAKEATRDFGKEAARASKEAERAALMAERATARKLAAEERARVRMIAAAEKAAAKEEALAVRTAARVEREAQRKAVAAEKAAARAAAAYERAAAREARMSPSMGGITGSMSGGGGGGKGPLLPIGNASSMGPDPKAFSKKAVDDLRKSLGLMGDKAKDAGFQLGFVSRIIAAMGVRALVREVFQLADAYTTLQNKLRITVGEDSLGFISKEIFKIAQDSRMSLESVATVFSRTTRSVKALGKSQQEVLVFTDALSKAIAVGGSNSVEASNAMIQLSQGMGSGALRGDELRSVLEQLPVVAELIADKMGVPIAALRKLGSQGAITTDVIFDAISGKSEELTEKMKTMQLTVGQAWTMMKNQATMSSAAMQGVMNALANTIQFVTNNFDGFVTVLMMLASGGAFAIITRGFLMAKDAVMAFGLATTVAFPWAQFAVIIASITGALIPLVAQLRITESSTVTFGDVWSSTWDQIREDVTGDTASGVEEIDNAMVGLAESTKLWFLSAAAGVDAFTSMLPVLSQMKGLLAWATDSDAATMFYDKTKQIIDRVDRDAQFNETERLINENKDILAQDMALDGGISEEDRIMKELDAEREGLLAYAKILEAKDKKDRGKKSGKTFAELMEELNYKREEVSLIDDSANPSIASRVAREQNDAEKGLINALTESQAELVHKTIEEKVILEDMLKLRENIKKSIEEAAKAERKALEDYSEKFKKFQEAQKKAVLDFQEARADRETTRHEGFMGTAADLDPNVKIREQIAELEKFKQIAKENNLADWAKLATKEIDALKASMRWENTHFETFADQMNSIFGPGGTLIKGFADAAANAIVMSESLGDLRRALVDVLNSVQKQALSAMIQLPLNLAMGALTNSLSGGAGPTSLGEGARSVGAAEASSWGLKSLSTGGYTGNAGVNDVTGVVHGQEFVLNAEATRRMGKQNLEMINKGGKVTSASSGNSAQVTVHNYAGVQVETSQLSPGEVQVMITKALRDQAGKIIAGAINNPNSDVSRSLQKNVNSERRRT